MLNALRDVVSALTGKPVQVAAEVALLSGGRIGDEYADLTAEQFSEQREAAESIAQKKALRSRIDTAWNRIGTIEQVEAIAGFRAIADELEAP
jgi:hypothetical protein